MKNSSYRKDSKDLIKDNQRKILKILLKRLRHDYHSGLYKTMESHPNFPSFLALSYALKSIGIDNIAIQTTFVVATQNLIDNEKARPSFAPYMRVGSTSLLSI